MIKSFENKSIGAQFYIADEIPFTHVRDKKLLMFTWNVSSRACTMIIDEQPVDLLPDTIICTTYLHNIQIDNSGNDLKYLLFNREFYCIHTNDSEVSCNGLLFFGSDYIPSVAIPKSEQESFKTLFSVLSDEFDNNGAGREEMLRILLKRFIIKCTRLANQQIVNNSGSQNEIDIIRRFNVLVEEHFKTKKAVKDYAKLMFKSPKTVANVFSKNSDYTPLEVIHNRVIIEAKRKLLYTDLSAKEIGRELGYHDPAQFSKLFKKQTGLTTTQFKNDGKISYEGSIDNSA